MSVNTIQFLFLLLLLLCRLSIPIVFATLLCFYMRTYVRLNAYARMQARIAYLWNWIFFAPLALLHFNIFFDANVRDFGFLGLLRALTYGTQTEIGVLDLMNWWMFFELVSCLYWIWMYFIWFFFLAILYIHMYQCAKYAICSFISHNLWWQNEIGNIDHLK